MAAAEVFAKLKGELPGTVKLIFQPAEEGLPPGEPGGAKQMLKEGAFENPRPDAVLGLHASSALPAGKIGYRSGPRNAGADQSDGRRTVQLQSRRMCCGFGPRA